MQRWLARVWRQRAVVLEVERALLVEVRVELGVGTVDPGILVARLREVVGPVVASGFTLEEYADCLDSLEGSDIVRFRGSWGSDVLEIMHEIRSIWTKRSDRYSEIRTAASGAGA